MAGAGKGRVSNDLVAASCAAVLAVYAAGYWRTRDAARSIQTQAQQRRPVRAEASMMAGAPAAADAAAADTAAPSLPVEPLPATPAATPGEPALANVPVAEQASAEPDSSSAPRAAPEPAVSRPVPARPVPAIAAEAKPAVVEQTVPSAPAAVAAAEPPIATESPKQPDVRTEPYWRDGTFTGWGTSRHGDIKAQVVIRDGRIVESGIVSCETRYPCDVIERIIPQPVQFQSPEVDRVSRATESADAYYYALVNALAEALVEPSLQAAAPK